jgi:hypothetical protein
VTTSGRPLPRSTPSRAAASATALRHGRALPRKSEKTPEHRALPCVGKDARPTLSLRVFPPRIRGGFFLFNFEILRADARSGPWGRTCRRFYTPQSAASAADKRGTAGLKRRAAGSAGAVTTLATRPDQPQSDDHLDAPLAALPRASDPRARNSPSSAHAARPLGVDL